MSTPIFAAASSANARANQPVANFSRWPGSTYLPDEPGSTLTWLAEQSWRRQEALFLAWIAKLSELCPVPLERSGLDSCAREYRRARAIERATLVTHPVFWLELQRSAPHVPLALTEVEASVTQAKLRVIADAYRRTCSAIADPDTLRAIGGIEVRRWDTDPLIAELAPPTYTFPPADVALQRAKSDAYTLPIFRDVADVALSRVGSVWPALGHAIPSFIRILVHIPEADVRSASADRYRGVVFMSSDDVCLLEVEESLVHELGHQVLYHAMRLDPLVTSGEEGDYELPWSGSRRDFYGYLHAFYIYLLLAKYLERALRDPEHDPIAVRPLLDHILDGLRKASEDFEPDERFTPMGRAMIERLCDEAHTLDQARLTI
jgi:hypothetical protein